MWNARMTEQPQNKENITQTRKQQSLETYWNMTSRGDENNFDAEANEEAATWRIMPVLQMRRREIDKLKVKIRPWPPSGEKATSLINVDMKSACSFKLHDDIAYV